MPNVYKPSFAGGEWKPSLHQRTDVSKYGVACRALLNYIVHPSGGISNRGGTRYINRAKFADKNTRLIPFEFNTDQAYALEFGDLYMRVLVNGGQVLEANKTITGATQADPCVITAAAHGFSNGDWVFIQSVAGMTEINGDFYLVANSTTNTFEITDLDGNDIDASNFEAYTSGGTVARVYEIETPYAHGDLARLKFTQSADVMTITHPSYDARELSRTGNAAWTLSLINFVPDVTSPEGASVSATTGSGSTTYKYRVTAVALETAEESLPALNTTSRSISGATQADPVVITATGHGFADGDQVYIDSIVGMTELNGNRYIVANQTANTFELKGIDGTGFTAYTSGGAARRTHVQVNNDLTAGGSNNENTITWDEVADAEKYNIYKEDNGIYGYIGSSEITSFVDDNIAPELDDTPPKSRNPFDGTNKRPSCVNLYEQRRVFANTNEKRDTVFTSQTSNYSNMNVSSPAKADDALTFTLAGNKVNEIRHLVTMGDLIAFTSGAEWRIAGADNQPLQPDTINAQRQSGRGASHVPPIVIGNTCLYVQARGKKVRDFRYTLEADGYDGTDVSILSSHLFRKTRLVDKRIKEWAYQQEPDSLVWTVHNDGSLTSFTYEREHEVWSWARHETIGKFQSVCGIPEDDDDRIYFITERIINGSTVQYIEVLETRVIDEDDIEYSYHVDCGITVEENTNATISGLSWLEGETVAILADGNELPSQMVENGSITMDQAYRTVTIGLPYNCDMQPLDIEFETREGHTKGYMKKVNKIFAHVFNSRQLKVAPKDPNDPCLDPDEKVRFEDLKQREWEDYDEPTKLKVGIIEIEVDSEWQHRAAPYFRHDSPTPISILSIAPQVELADG